MFRMFLRRHQIFLLNFTSASALLTLGDFTVQMFYEKDRKFNKQRLFAASVTGGLIGIEGHLWYDHLDRFLMSKTWRNVWKKVFLDQLVATPIYTLTFILGTSFLEGRQSFEQLKQDTRDNFLTLYLADCLLFVPIQLINFKYIPSSYRVVFLSIVAFLFDAGVIAYKHRNL